MIVIDGPLSKFSFSLIGGRCLAFNLYGLAISLAYPSGEDRSIYLFQMISTCLRESRRLDGGGGGQHPVGDR